MTESSHEPRTRRGLLRSAAAGAAGLLLGRLARPEPTSATTGAMQFGTSNNAGLDHTRLTSTSAVTTLGVDNTGTGKGLHAIAGSPTGIAVYGVCNPGYGVLGDTGHGMPGVAGVWGRDWSTPPDWPAVGAAGSSEYGTGVTGYSGPGATTNPPGGAGAVGVLGYAPAGIGVYAQSDTNYALKVVGKALFDRSGRVLVPKGRAYVDVDLRPWGGLGGAPLCFANILTRRAGVHVETVRPNYPVAGKLRIYLNKVPSLSTSTAVAWIVMN
jgi:hypothetical protein